MGSLMRLAVACLVGQLPAGTPSAPSEPAPTLIDADLLDIDTARQLWVGHGHAVLTTSAVKVQADELTYDPVHQHATARGHVTMVSGLMTAFADEVEVDVQSMDATVSGGRILEKRGVSPEALIAAKTPAELEKLGQNAVAMSGRHIKRLGPNHFDVDGLSFTPCDCDPAKPSWHVSSSSADVIPGERAKLAWPVVYVGKVPVLALPWMYLPLADRRSGLLIPRPAATALNGDTIDAPVFVTLGRSYDLTFTPGYYDGGSDPTFGIRGPRLLSEFEYAPSDKTRGSAKLGLIYDLRDQRIPSTGLPAGTGKRGLRSEGALQHVQDLGGGFYDSVFASFVSDGFYTKDLNANIFARENQYVQSNAAFFHRDADSYVGAHLGVRQDLRWGYGFFDNARRAEDIPSHGPNTPQKLPELIYDLPERHLGGPLFGAVRFEYARLSPFAGQLGFDPRYVQVDGNPNAVLDPNPLEARQRLDIRPRISADLWPNRFTRFTPYAAYREDLYIGEITGTSVHRGYPLAGAFLSTEISRAFGDTAVGYRHSITPSVELRYVPWVFGSGPRAPYDEIDRSVPFDPADPRRQTGFLQGTAQITQRLFRRDSFGVKELLRLDLGEGYDLRNGNLGDAFARAVGSTGPFNANALLRYDVRIHRVAQASAGAAFEKPGYGFSVQYDNLITGGPDRLRRGIDMLVGPPRGKAEGDERAQILSARAGIRFKFGLGIRYEVNATPRIPSCALAVPPTCSPEAAQPGWSLLQQSASLSFSPSCDCWRFEVLAFLPAGQKVPDFAATLTLARFGSFGTK